jgi:hypothetical protein
MFVEGSRRSQLKRLLVGQPIPSHLAHHERLSRPIGLAVLSSDALSSVACATEEILRVLVLAGAAALSAASPIALVIATILVIVVFSYRQTIHAYPNGGGAYIVGRDSLGETPALIAAAALLIDYVLTVAVCIAAGVAAITSAVPTWHVNRVELRLASILARDRHLPRQFMNQGGLAFSNGIVGLSVLAAILLVVFGGGTHALIPLYMIGVFVSFTISQAGMVARWRRLGEPGWRAHAAMNAVGALVTGIVLIVVAVTKAHEGAWIILLLIPIHVVLFRKTRRHYDAVAKQLTLRNVAPEPKRRHNIILVPISGVQRAVVEAVNYARSLSDDVRALYVDVDPAATEQIRCEWRKWADGLPLVVLESPYRSLMEPLLEYIESVDRDSPDDYVTVVLPEFVPARWWHHVFHNQRALLIKGALLFRPRTVVTSVPFHLSH